MPIAIGMATKAAAPVAMRAKRMEKSLLGQSLLPEPALKMPPVNRPDAALLRFQGDIEIRYASSIVNVYLLKIDILHCARGFARMNPDG
jgi:hypothetical protein